MYQIIKGQSILLVGAQGMKMSHFIGGVKRAATLVRAMVLGSSAFVATRIERSGLIQTPEKLCKLKLNKLPGRILDAAVLQCEPSHFGMV
jgi:hypothetical protein